MRILVTVADGFLGSSVVRRFGARMPGTCPDCVINLAASVDFPGSALPNLYAVNVLCPSILSEWFPDRRPLVSAGPDANDQLVEVSSELGPYRSFRAALKDCRQ